MKSQPRPGIFLFILTLLLASFSVQAQLNVNFSADKTTGCSPLTVSFTNKTTGASANAIYKWDLGNGNTSALANPAGVYTGVKSYTVTLTVQDGSQTASKTVTITVNPEPVVNFSASVVKGCIPMNTTFTPTIQAGSGNITSCYWDFGDGATQQSALGLAHTYTQAQKASVIVTATNNYGCYTTVSKKNYVTVLPALKAGFTAPDMVCRETDPVQFTDTSSGPGTLSYAWSFSDGSTATQQNPSHVFKTKGVYSATLTLTSSEGCVATKTVSNLNVATFKTDFDVPPFICTGSSIYFNNTSTPSNTNLMWVVNNSQFYNYYYSLPYSFYTPATYTIKLINNFGACKDSVEKQISVKQTPSSQGFIADIKNACGVPTDVEFKDTTPNAAKWEWNFDTYPNNVESYIQNPVKNYTQKSIYNVRLTVTTADGCQKYIPKTLDLRDPEVNIGFFNPDKPGVNARTCTNNRVGFSSYNFSGEEIVSYNWNFGDGGTSTDEKPIHVYTVAGTYTVTLTYTTKKGCTFVSKLTDFAIPPESKITGIFATATTVCGNAPITFTSNVTTQVNNWPYYYWYFGDGTSTGTQGAQPVTHQYFKDSAYTVTLIWMGGNGNCPDTMIKTGFIKVLPPVPVITAWENTCEGMRDTVTFRQSSVKAQSWTWDFGDGASQYLTTDEPAVKHIYANTGAYKVVLTTTNGQCSVRDSVVAYVVKKQKPLLTSGFTSVCNNSPLTFTVSNVEPNPYGGIKVYWLTEALYGDDSYAGG
jgi:PKD repeat protein